MKARTAAAVTLIASALAPGAPTQVLITEVVPGVTQTQVSGDQVELFNAGSSAVDLTDWVISDLDPVASETNPSSEGTFAPSALSVPALQPGEFCVVTFVDPGAPTGDNESVTVTGYGFDISVELNPNFESTNEQVALLDDTGALVDSIAWHSLNAAVTTDAEEDVTALTVPDSFGYPLGALDDQSAWAGLDTVNSTTEYRDYTVDFTAYDGETATGEGSIQRINVGTEFMQGVPDGADYFTVTAIASATLGGFPLDAADGSLAVLTDSGDLEAYLAELDQPGTDRPKLADGIGTDDFVIPSNVDRVIFRRVCDLMFAEQYAEAHYHADRVGMELVLWTDTITSHDFYLMREQANAGDPGFRGLGTFVWDNTSTNSFLISAPHPLFDSLTVDEGAMMVVQVRPRLYMVAGTHRRNSTTDTPCDGTFMGGPYPISDCAHSVITFFQMAHEQFVRENPAGYHLQLHGFGATPSSFDVILSEGVNYVPPAMNFIQAFEDQIDMQNFMADGTDLTEAAVYAEDEFVLGGTTNTQGRVTNGIQWALACTEAVSSGIADGHFIHMEQDIDVRQEPQHIIDALLNTISLLSVPVGLSYFGEETP